MNYLCVVATLNEAGIYTPNSDTYRLTGNIDSFKLELSAYLHNNPTTAYAMFPERYGLMFAKIPTINSGLIDTRIVFDFVSFDVLFKKEDKNDSSIA